MRGPEAKIQDALRDYGKKLGWRVRKRSTSGPWGSNGEPDLEFMRYPSEIFFVEVKAPGKKSTPLQVEMQEQIRQRGFYVYECDSVDEGKRIINFHSKMGTKVPP